jgi:hypothetical protein
MSSIKGGITQHILQIIFLHHILILKIKHFYINNKILEFLENSVYLGSFFNFLTPSVNGQKPKGDDVKQCCGEGAGAVPKMMCNI